jgi:iron complex outermembrane receptor protein
MAYFGMSGRARAAMGGAALGALLFASGGAAHAAAAASSGGGTTLGEVVVTAQKRSENLQKSPIAITAFTGSKIEQANLAGPAQLQFNVPSMTFGYEDGFTFITLRGVGTDTTGAAESSVATYQDGVYTGTLIAESVSNFDLQRIEILRGPQGTLYGRNTTGGVVNYITKPPSFNPGANASVSYGNYNAVQTDIGVTGPIVSDKIAGRLSFHYSDHDGYRFNLSRNEHAYAEQNFSGRGSILFQPTSHLSITLRGDATHEKSNPAFILASTHSLDGVTSQQTPLGLFSLPESVLATIVPPTYLGVLSPSDLAKLNGGSIASYYGLTQPGLVAPDPSKTLDFTNASPTNFLIDSDGASVTIDWDLGAAQLKSISAYRYSRLFFENDSAGMGVPEVDFSPYLQTDRQVTQEFNLSGKAFNDRLDWLVGLFYFHDDTSEATTIWLPPTGEFYEALVNLSNPPGSPYVFNLDPPSLTNLNYFLAPNVLQTVVVDGSDYGGHGHLSAFSSIPTTGFLGFNTQVHSQSIAGFAQATFKITDALRLTGGFRYTADDKQAVRSLHSNFLYTVGTLFGFDPGLCNKVESHKSWSAPTGTVGIDYDVAPHVLTYGKISWGYKGGGANAGECHNLYNPEYLTSYEGGIKAIFADGQILTNAAMYYYDYKQIQFVDYINNASTVLNAGSAKVFGVELEYAIQPRAIPGLQIDGSASFEDSHYGPGCFGDPANINGAGALFPANPAQCPATNLLGHPVLASAQINGNELLRAPRWKTNFGAQYTAHLGDGGSLMLRGDAAWTEKYYNDIWNGKAPFLAATTQPAYWIVNASLVWTSADKRYQAQVFANNLTNTYYATNRTGFNTPAALESVGSQWGPPRTYGVRLSMKLGSSAN